MAMRLVHALQYDVWPSPATQTDVGIDSAVHLGALQFAVDCGCTAYELDRVMGDGPAITQLVRCYPGNPYRHVTFRTLYDGLLPLVQNEE